MRVWRVGFPSVVLLGLVVLSVSVFLATPAVAQVGQPRVLASWDFENGLAGWIKDGNTPVSLQLAVGPNQAAEGQCALMLKYKQTRPFRQGGGGALVVCPITQTFPEPPTCLEFDARSTAVTPLAVVLVDAKGGQYATWVWVEPGEWRHARIYLRDLTYAGPWPYPGPMEASQLKAIAIVDGLTSVESQSGIPLDLPDMHNNELRLDSVLLTTQQPPHGGLLSDPTAGAPNFFLFAKVSAPVQRVALSPGEPAWRVQYTVAPGRFAGIHWFADSALMPGSTGIELTLRAPGGADFALDASGEDPYEFAAPIHLAPGKVTKVRLLWKDFVPASKGRPVKPDDPRAADVLDPTRLRSLVIGDTAETGQPEAVTLDVGPVRILHGD